MTNAQGAVDPYDPAYIYRSIFGKRMRGHRQTWPFIDMEELKSINSDCVGWVHMDSSPINYPVVKQRLDHGYYLTHNFSGEESVHGQVSIDFLLGGNMGERTTVLRAHSMKDWSMFMAIISLEKPDYFAEHRCIEFMLDGGRYRARWFAGVLYRSADPWPERVRFADDADYAAWLQRVSGANVMPDAPWPDARSRVLVCSTCAYYQEPNDMFAAMAVIGDG